MADAATAWIERYTGRSWQAGAISNEIHTVYQGAVRLGRPVSSVSGITYRTLTPDETPTVLGVDSWELFDVAAGLVLVSLTDDTVVLVSYTPAGTVPADVAHAATMIAASWLHPTLNPSTAGIDQISVGQNDVSVKFSSDARTVPNAALLILSLYRRVVFA